MVNKRGHAGARAGAWRVTKYFPSFTRCSRRCFLCVDGELGKDGHTVMLLLTLRRLQRFFLSIYVQNFQRRVSMRFAAHLLS